MSSKKDELMKKALAASKHTQVISEGTNTLYNFKATEISIEKIMVEEQVRKQFNPEYIKELAQSIREIGLIQPITVRAEAGQYRLITGECRLRAFKELRKSTIPAIIRKVEDDAILIEQITENVTRSDINPIEEAEGYERLIKELNFSQQLIADKTGKSKSRISTTLRLLDLREKVSPAKLVTFSRSHLEELVSVINEPFFNRLLEESPENLSRNGLRDIINFYKRSVKEDPDEILKKRPSHTGITLTLDDKNEKLKLTVTWENESEKAIIEDFKRELTEVVSKKADEFRKKYESVAVKFNITTKTSKPELDSESLVLARSSKLNKFCKLASDLNKNQVLDHIKSTLDVEIEKVKDFETEFLIDQYNCLPYRNPKDPSAVFFKSVTNNWTLPPRYIKEKNATEFDPRKENQHKEAELKKLETKLLNYNEFIKKTDGIELDSPTLKMRENMIKEIPTIMEGIQELNAQNFS
jgi:ParB family chromosome partitioning protein